MFSLNILGAFFAVIAISVPHAAGQSADPCAVVAAAQAKSTIVPPKPGDRALLAVFDAETAYKCVTSVPMNKNHALQMIDIALEYFSFQTTLAYLKDPPKSYLQPPVDVFGRFNQIRQNINANSYPNQYSLDLDILSIVRDTHEGHFAFSAGVLGLFQWILPDKLVSFSRDGKELPQIYSYLDIMHNVSDPSPVVQLGGQSVFTYLRSYVANGSAMGLVDPHAEWNVLMQNSAYSFGKSARDNEQSYAPGFFESTHVYNGPSIKGSFANGTSFEWKYQAGSTSQLGQNGLTTGEKIYTNHVMNPNFGSKKRKRDVEPRAPSYLPRSPVVERATSSTIETAVPLPNYPDDPIVVQKNFSSGGTVSGYLLESDSIGVLSLPSFLAQQGLGDSLSFHDAVASFIKQAQAKGMKKIVIDLSGNAGGNVFLGYDIFKMFFPSGESGSAVRTRINPPVNTYGSILTGVARDNGTFFDASAKRVFGQLATLGSGQVNADLTLNQNRTAWKSWGSFCTPQPIHGDNFTKLATYNLSDSRITNELGFPVANTDTSQGSSAAPWAAEDIVLLLDGYCASTCSIFADLMKNDAGVKSVVVGGVPQNSPMQGVAGTRGSSFVEWDLYTDLSQMIDMLMEQSPAAASRAFSAVGLNASDISALPTRLTDAPWNVVGGVNALDSVRMASPQEPRQFTYQAANCRLFYTREMVQDIRQVWRAAAKVAGGDTSQCVSGSVDGPGSGINETVTGPVGFTADTIWTNANSTDGAHSDNNSGSNSAGSKLSGSTYRAGLAGLAVGLAIVMHSF